jgi:hypothetical protein
MGTMSEALRGHMADMEGLHKECYPDHPELAKSVDEEPEGGNGDDADMGGSPMQKFLARSRLHRQGVKGIALQLMQLSDSKHIPKQFKSQLGQLGRRLSGIGKAADTGSATAMTEDDSKRYDALEAKVDALVGKINDAIPHLRN